MTALSTREVNPPAADRGFWRKVAWVLSGTAAAQAIPLLGSLVIARLVVPAAFGIFAAWLGVCALLTVVITGRYENALALEADGEPRRAGVRGTLDVVAWSALVLIAACAATLVLRPEWSATLPPALIVAAVPAAVLVAVTQTWQNWAAAEGRYGALSTMRIAQAAGITGGQIAGAFIAPSAATLAWMQVLGLAIGLTVAVHRMPLAPWPARAAARAFRLRHARFPRWSLAADSINAAAGQLPVILVAARFGAEVAGLLALALRTLSAPIALLGSAVLDVFKRRASQAYRARGECRAEYVETFKVLAAAGVVTALAIVLAGEPLFTLAFGDAWRHAGTIAAWLAPLFALRFVASPLSYMMYVADKQPVDLAWQCGLLVLTPATLMLPATHREALLSYMAAYSAMYVVYLALSYRYAHGRARAAEPPA